MLAAVMKDSGDIPAAESAVFVLNKWDKLIDETSECPEEREKTKHIVAKKLSHSWRGFKRSQLVTLDAKHAAKQQRLGHTTNDLKLVCERIGDTLPRGMGNMIRRSIRYGAIQINAQLPQDSYVN